MSRYLAQNFYKISIDVSFLLASPTIQSNSDTDALFISGSYHTFQYKVQGFPLPQVTWYKRNHGNQSSSTHSQSWKIIENGEIVNETVLEASPDQREFSKIINLRFHVNESFELQCLASNSVGETRRVYTVRVKGKSEQCMYITHRFTQYS